MLLTCMILACMILACMLGYKTTHNLNTAFPRVYEARYLSGLRHMSNKCLTHTYFMAGIYLTHAQHMLNTRLTHTYFMAAYPTHAKHLPSTCPAHAQHMPSARPAHAQRTPSARPAHAQHMPNECPTLVQCRSRASLRHTSYRYLSGVIAGSTASKIGYVAAFPIPEVVQGIDL